MPAGHLLAPCDRALVTRSVIGALPQAGKHGEPTSVGDEIALMVDNSQLLTFKEALAVGRTLDELKYHWFEDPIRYTDLDGLTELSRRLDVPIAATDHADFRFFEVLPHIQRGAVRIIRSDPPKTGITGLKKLASVCEAFGLNCEIHHGGNSLMNVANLHVTMAVSNCDYYEVFPASGANKYGLVEDIEVDERGMVRISDRPGLGYEIDWDLVKRNQTAVIR